MSKRRDKATKLIDAFDKATSDRAVLRVQAQRETEEVDEVYFMARTRLNYYINSLLTKIRSLEAQL